MKEFVKRGHLLGLTVYSLTGIYFLIYFGTKPGVNPSFAWAGIITWWIGAFSMVFAFVKKWIPLIVFELLYVVFASFFIFWFELITGTDFLMLLLFMLEWIVVLTFLNKSLLHVEAFMQALLCVISLILPDSIFIPQGLIPSSIPVVIISIVAADWMCHIICKGILQMNEENLEHERSLDDLVAIVEAKHNEAKEATKAKSQFLSNMSHEIRTPINAVLGIDEMILRESHEESIKDYAKDIKNSGNVLLSLVNDILDISKIEEGRMELVSVNFSLKNLINNVKNMVNTQMSNKGLNFIVSVDETIPVGYRGDDVRITQILVNLLTNAVKYTHEGSVEFTLTGQRAGDNERLHFSVKDTGIGIKSEDLKKISDKFVRFDEEKNRYIEGTGLGMTIVSAFLSMMNSNLEASSEYGKGSTFSFTLELPIVDDTPMATAGERKIANNIPDNVFTAPDAQVLVVDDNSLNIKVFVGLLKRSKVKIDTACSGQEAIDMGEIKKYDIIFMDHMMPEMDGIEAMKRMKGTGKALNADTPFIALTANVVANVEELYLEAGFSNYLPKPVQPNLLEQMVMKYVGEQNDQ